MEISTIIPALAGGVLIGLAAVGLMLFNGRIAGVTGIASGLLTPSRGDTLWRAMFVAGLVLGGVVLLGVYPQALPSTFSRSLPLVALAGLLVGFGTRLGNGCTSGHGVCGIGRMSRRSIVATATFTASGALAVLLYNTLSGGSL
jgi:uncharacterized membrane protein YedE/YeeE